MFALSKNLSRRAMKRYTSTSYNMFGSFNNIVDSELDRNFNPNIIPKYWNGVLPHTIDFSKFTIDCGGSIPILDDAMQTRMRETYERERILYLTNTGCTKMIELQPYIDLIMAGESSEYIGGGNERHKLEPYFYETGAPR